MRTGSAQLGSVSYTHLDVYKRQKLYIQEDLRGKNVDKIKALAAEKKVSISWTPKKTLQEMTEGAEMCIRDRSQSLSF